MQLMSYGDIHNSTGTICKARFRTCPLEDSESGGHSESIEGFIEYQASTNDIPKKELKALLDEGLPPKDALEVIEGGYDSAPKSQKSLKDNKPVMMKLANGGEVEITPGLIDDNAIKLYKEGQCMAFATTLAERKGGKVALITDGNGTVVHAFSAKDGMIEDISGSMSLKSARASIDRQNDAAYKNNQYEMTKSFKLMSPRKMRKLLESNKGSFKVGSDVGDISQQNFEMAETFVDTYLKKSAND